MSTPVSGRSPGIGFIFVTLMLAIVGMGLLIPVLPQLIVQMRGGDITAGVHGYGWIVGVYAFMQFIGSPILGSLSDRFGRRRIILIATAGSAIDYVIMANAPSMTWLFVARVIAGFTAGIMATANAYIVDVTPPERRAGAFGLLGAAFGIGFIIGPALGGFLGGINLRLPFWVAAGCSAVNWLYGYFVLPESLKPEHRRPFSMERANPIGAVMALRRFPAVLSLAESYFILMFAQMMMFSTWALYMSHRFQWNTTEVGLSLMFSGALSGVFQAVVVKSLVPKIGETRAVVLGLAVNSIAMLAYGSAPHGWMIYVIMALGSFAGISGPALQAYITKHVPANEQGAVQGVFGGLASLAGIPAPLLVAWSLGWAVAAGRSPWLAGLPFYISGVLIMVALSLAARSFRRDAHVVATGATEAVAPTAA